MPTLRDHVRQALARTEPTDREAKSELATVLARSRGEIHPWWRLPVLVATAGVAVALAVLLVVRSKPAPPPPPTATGTALYLYVHVDGEPIDRALTLDLTTKGEH